MSKNEKVFNYSMQIFMLSKLHSKEMINQEEYDRTKEIIMRNNRVISDFNF